MTKGMYEILVLFFIPKIRIEITLNIVIINRGQEVMGLRSDKHPCVTLALIASMPRVFESVQDKCITKANCKKDSKSFYVSLI